MVYQRLHDIELRLSATLDLIRAGGHSTARIADKLGVSVPTVSRDITALRERGFDIRPARCATGWEYVLKGAEVSKPGFPRVEGIARSPGRSRPALTTRGKAVAR